MGRYYFHYRDKHGLVADLEGQEFASADAARAEAVLAAKDAIADALTANHPEPVEASYEVTDENDWLIAVVPFRTVIDPVPPS